MGSYEHVVSTSPRKPLFLQLLLTAGGSRKRRQEFLQPGKTYLSRQTKRVRVFRRKTPTLRKRAQVADQSSCIVVVNANRRPIKTLKIGLPARPVCLSQTRPSRYLVFYQDIRKRSAMFRRVANRAHITTKGSRALDRSYARPSGELSVAAVTKQ